MQFKNNAAEIIKKLTTLNKKKPSQKKKKNVCLKFYVKRDLKKKNNSTLHGSNIPENFINKIN